MKRVLLVINNLNIGGAEKLVLEKYFEFKKRGFEVKVLTLLSNRKGYSFEDSMDINDDRISLLWNGFFNIAFWMGLLKTFKEFKPDYVYSHLWFSNLVTKILKLSGLKFNLICYEHNVYDSVKTRKQFLFDRFTQSLPKKIIAVSEDVSRSLVRNGINSKNIITLNNAINIEKFSSVKKNFKAKMEFGIPRESFVFLHLGRFVPQKAHDVLLKAFSEVNKDSFLICAGDGGLRDAMIELSKKLDLSKRILFLKNINDSRKLFEVVDVFVLPSRHEGLSIALLEAMAAGMPVISSDYVGARKIIVHGENGYVVPIDNIKKLSYFMNEIIDNPGVIRKFSQKNKEDVSKYSIENYLNTLLMI